MTELDRKREGEPPAEPDRTTRLLECLGTGDAAAAEELASAIYDELKTLAQVQLAREGADHTLQPTALVNEAYLRLVRAEQASFDSRHHFYAMAAKVMRSILVDHARRKKSRKRGGDRAHTPLESEPMDRTPATEFDVLDLHDALERLAAIDEALARFVELRYFGGLTVKDISRSSGTPVRTVERRLHVATAWLREHLAHDRGTD